MAPPLAERELALAAKEEALDLERDTEREIEVHRVRAPMTPAGAGIPFDLEQDGSGPADLQPTVAGPNAPFDLERESVRAA